jgi:hypothetical protein
VINLRKEVFDAGLDILIAAGQRKDRARSIIGKWRKEHGEEAVLSAIRRARDQAVSEPVSFITACLKAQSPDNAPPRTAAEILAEMDRDGTYDGVH